MSVRLSSRTIAAAILLVLAAGCTYSPEAKKARHLERGERFFSGERYREALIEYRNVRRIEAGNLRAIRQIGLAHFQLGEMAQAFDYLRRTRDAEPNDPDVRMKLGTIYLLARQTREAHEEAAFVLSTAPGDLEASLLSAASADTPQKVEQEVRRLEALLPRFGSVARLHIGLGTLYLRQGDFAATERAFKEAVAREPGLLEARASLGDFYMARGEATLAEGELKAAAGIAPFGSRPRLKLADFYLLRQNPGEAKRILTEITEKAPDYVPAWRRRAEIAFMEGKPDESLKLLAVVFKKSASDVDAAPRGDSRQLTVR